MLLEASAGTGKTYALERIVARLVGREENPLKIDEILVVTFTNRAAREMKERIRTLLSSRAEETDRNAGEKERYRAAVSGFDRSAVYTIHGFCQMVLSSWPFESSAPFHQELVPGGELERQELRSWIAGLKEEDLDRELMRTAYRQAGSFENLIAGISKIMVSDNIPPDSLVLPGDKESESFASFVESSSLPDSPLALAAGALFLKEWSDDALKDVIKKGTGKSKKKESLEKIRSHLTACGKLISRGECGIIPLSEALFGDPSGTGAQGHFQALITSGISLAGDAPIGETASLVSALSGLFHQMEPYVEISGESLDSLIKPYMQCAFQDMAVKAVNERLEYLKNRNGSFGYADLIKRVARKVAETDSPLLKVLRSKFAAALIDEFQDTDPRQWNLFNTIFGSSKTHHVLALIGDPKQSIYGFRGTGLQAYNKARSDVLPRRIFRLDTNYRSAPLLVQAANEFFTPLFKPRDFQGVKSGKTDNPVLLLPGGIADNIPVTLIPGDKKEDAAVAIGREIRRLLDNQNPARWHSVDGKKMEVSASDIAVLVRTSYEGDLVIDCLDQAGIPVVNIRNNSIFIQDVAGLIINLMEAFDHPADMSLWRSVLLDDLFELPPDLLLEFQDKGLLDEFVERGGEWRQLFISGRSTEAFEDFFSFSRRMGAWSERTEYLKVPWHQRIIAGAGGLRRWQNWRQLSELVQNRQTQGVLEIPRIISWMREQAEATALEDSETSLRLESEDPAVRVLTMHSAKGLEFPLVFLLGGFNVKTPRGKDNDYRFDDGGTLVVDRICRDSNRDAHLSYGWEEDKRLWYVAFTRASVKLWISYPREGGVSQVESLLDEAFRCRGEAAAEVSRIPPYQSLSKKNEAGDFRERLSTAIREKTAETPRLFSLMETRDEILPPLPAESRPKPSKAELPDAPVSRRDPLTSSYTSLVKSAPSMEEDDRDVDAVDDTERGKTPEIAESLPMAADRGAQFGTLVHALLEECDFQKVRDLDLEAWYADGETDELFNTLSRRYYPPDWYVPRAEDLKNMVWNTLRSPIPGLGRLCDVKPREMRAELEFQMAVPRRAELTEGSLRTSLARGFLKGFIDLCLNNDGVWWVADWKTNVPPGVESADAYDDETMGKMMDHSHYHLQYELYLLALCRTLSCNSGKPVDWEGKIGGAAYLFVRGTRKEDCRGVYVAKPTLERMLSLASAMGLEGVLK